MVVAAERTGGTAVVVGGGTMGAGIAQSFLTSDATTRVLLVEATADALEAALARVTAGLERQFRKDGDASAAVARSLEKLVPGQNLDSAGGPDLIVEAVPEDFALKQGVLAHASSTWPGALLASNTSSLSLNSLASELEHPENFIGMHFFNPVPISKLIELVVQSKTSEAALDAARQWVSALGKESIEVRDSPGFATSRLGVAIGLEAIRMVEDGVATAADIDRGMVLGYRFPIGPLELTDLVGLDVRLAIADHLAGELGSRFEAPSLLREMVASGQLGKKTGRGFFDWSNR